MGEDVRPRVVVVGSGMAAVMTLSALAETAGPAQRLTVLDPAPLSGEAFAAAAPEHLLNTRARVMGLTAPTIDGFSRFVAQALGVREEEAATAFAPRSLYGRFLKAGLEQAIATLQRRGWSVRRRRAAAQGLIRQGGGWIVDTDRGPLPADQVVLAIGPDRAEPFAGAISPWALTRSHAKADKVLIIGAGLTAADAAVRLAGLGHQGALTLVSPGPGLPFAQAAAAPEPARLTEPPLTQSPAALLRALRGIIAAGVAKGDDWRAAMDALRPLTPGLWAGLPAPARRRLLQSRRLLAWSRHRHRLPPQTAGVLEALTAQGRLLVRRDAVTAVEPGAVVLRQAGRQTFDLIVDARGFDLSYRRNGLVQQMIASGAAKPCPTGYGLAPDPRLQVGDGIYALGAVLSGALLETTAAPEIREQAGRIARALNEDALRQASCPHRR